MQVQVDAVSLKKTHSFSNCLIGLFKESGPMYVLMFAISMFDFAPSYMKL